ncbi:DEAD/DEAH box helicase [Rhodanobacter sp. 115]|uniref:DEAD/DEAH box helicase n=1 Tax=Rhodanobacter sp. FW021-MT20 TaxID=1162282 RepID=UPI000260EC20|nr:DEAD/DEAH box helicase [Rhodanobacter sp. 115]EIL97363.1 dead/deah box helicase domain protein [Rhodanobacter sp. 115]
MAASQAFLQLDPRIQRYLWAEGWGALRDVQEQAIPLILPGNQDVLVAASTASGKTEAAFLPALTHLLGQPDEGLIVYISPLKALINDQFGRLDRLCENLGIPVWPWHGDVTSTSKRKFMQKPTGVLLITPESLEATLCNRGTSIAALFKRMTFFVIDELHAFIGTERGKQLQALMHRIEIVLGRTVPRIGLSATLGDMGLAARFLRSSCPVAIVDATSTGSQLLILVKGFEEHPTTGETSNKSKLEAERAPLAIAQHMFKILRGSNNLVFPNSRREVERYTHLLNGLCEQAQVPKEFWPHHGNLSKEIRYETEAALKQRERSATAVCTSTLELGIDIGAVKSVAQIGTPPSVASLRQRLGRSGRREGEPAILRGYVIEDALDERASLETRLRLDTVQTAAAISLLLENWFEPPAVHGEHYSTLVQQLLSSIAQYGGLQAAHAFRLLCTPPGPFERVSKDAFAELLRTLGQKEILTQDHAGLLLHGRVGDKIVNHYSFYAAFTSDEEFRIVSGGKALGTLPVSQIMTPGQRILFGGRTWLIEAIDEEHKTIHVASAKGGTPPLFDGSGGRVHTRVRQRMRDIYVAQDALPFLDTTAQRFLGEGRKTFATLALADRLLLDHGSQAILLTWLGDATNEAIACLLMSHGIQAFTGRLGVEIHRAGHSLQEIKNLLADIASRPVAPVDELLTKAGNLVHQKWDGLLSPHLLRQSYASSNLELDEALDWLQATFKSRSYQVSSDT